MRSRLMVVSLFPTRAGSHTGLVSVERLLGQIEWPLRFTALIFVVISLHVIDCIILTLANVGLLNAFVHQFYPFFTLCALLCQRSVPDFLNRLVFLYVLESSVTLYRTGYCNHLDSVLPTLSAAIYSVTVAV